MNTNIKEKDALNAQKIWGLNSTSIIQANKASKKYKLKHGMFASVPLICKDKLCPYTSTCPIQDGQRIANTRCPVEIGAIMSRFDSWCKHFGIDTDSEYIKDEDLVDATLIRDLVDNEIQTLRAENKLAISGDFMGETLNTVDNKGNPWYEQAVTPEAEFKLTLQEKRYKILQLLNATRKDKSKEIDSKHDPSAQAMDVFNKINEKMKKINKENGDD